MLEMDQDVIRRLLEGRKSVLDEAAKKDSEARDSIVNTECPMCGELLRPQIPTDPRKVFRGLRIQYDKVCPTHGVISE
jgi:hypothetical protein